MEIRPARPQDASTIAEIYVRSWQQAFAGIIPQSYLDSMDVRRETLGWQSLLREAQWPKEGVLLADRAPAINSLTCRFQSRNTPGHRITSKTPL